MLGVRPGCRAVLGVCGNSALLRKAEKSTLQTLGHGAANDRFPPLVHINMNGPKWSLRQGVANVRSNPNTTLGRDVNQHGVRHGLHRHAEQGVGVAGWSRGAAGVDATVISDRVTIS
jgi:hypothetical protein